MTGINPSQQPHSSPQGQVIVTAGSVALVDVRLVRETQLGLARMAKTIVDAGVSAPEGTWELIREWRDLSPSAPRQAATSASGSGFPDADGQAGTPSASWITTAQAAKEAGVDPRTIRYRIDTGKLDATKVGDRWQIDPDSLKATS